MQVWQLRHFRIHDALSFKTVDSWKVHLKIDTIFNSSSIAPGDIPIIPISESISLFAIPTKVAMVSIRTESTAPKEHELPLRWHVSSCSCGICCSLSCPSFVICYKTPETINRYRMLGVSWGTNFLSELFDLFLFPGAGQWCHLQSQLQLDKSWSSNSPLHVVSCNDHCHAHGYLQSRAENQFK